MGNPGHQHQQRNQQTPTGTSGRQSGDTNSGSSDNNAARRPEQSGSIGGGSRVNRDDDEESGLGNRTTNR